MASIPLEVQRTDHLARFKGRHESLVWQTEQSVKCQLEARWPSLVLWGSRPSRVSAFLCLYITAGSRDQRVSLAMRAVAQRVKCRGRINHRVSRATVPKLFTNTAPYMPWNGNCLKTHAVKMASDVIDLISSSPVRTTTSRPSACVQQPAKRRDDIDDFDDLDTMLFDVLDDRQAKRKRTTGPGDAQTNCDKLTTAISSKPPLPLKEQTSRYQNPTIWDPIEFTSSLEPVSPAKEQIDKGLPSQTSVAKKAIGNSTCEDAISCFSSDPFAALPSSARETTC